MPREKLTVERIRRYSCPPEQKQVIWWDVGSPLGVRVTAGSKSYIGQTKRKGATVRTTIGACTDWKLDDARVEATRLKTLIKAGNDPRQEREDRIAAVEQRRQDEAAAKRRAELHAAPALDAWKVYVDARTAKWGALSRRDHARVVQAGGTLLGRGRRGGRNVTQAGTLRGLLAQPLPEITATRVQEWLRAEVAARPTHAALAYRLLRGFIRWAAARPEYRDQVHPEACGAKDVRDELPRPAAKTDCLQREQLKPWFAAVGKLPNPTHRVYLQALLLTGARRNELAALRWDDVDFAWGSITIRDKVAGSRTIPLTPYVTGLLRELKARNETPPKAPRRLRPSDTPVPEWKPSEWVFASPTAAGGYLNEPRGPHQKALAAAGLPSITLHGLRRSFGSLAEWVECPVGVVAQLMGHKPSATAEKHYRVRPLDLLRAWHTKIETWILTEAGIGLPSRELAPRLQVVQA